MKLFLTDYGSYNNGTQSEFGHWVDLNRFCDVDEFQEYIKKHFAECDKKSPIDEYGTRREETMFTDSEGIPDFLYSECGNLEEIFKYKDICDEYDFDDDGVLMGLHNELFEENHIYEFDEHFFELFFYQAPMAAARAACFGDVNWSHEYISFDGYGNLESFNCISDHVDKDDLIQRLLESA